MVCFGSGQNGRQLGGERGAFADLALGTELSDAGRRGMENGIALVLEELASLGVQLVPETIAVAGAG